MKLTKSLFLAFAGLGLFACSNEEVVENQLPAGSGAVSVKLVNPALGSRAIADPTDGDAGTTTIPITGEITVSLYEQGNPGTPAQTLTIDAGNIEADTKLTFWNVTAPGKITVSINGGQADYANVLLGNVQQAPSGIPAYGETSAFTKTNQTGSPILANDNDGTGNKTEQGAEEGDQNKTYQLYSATVTMAIPVARLEVSGITHVDEGSSCAYSKLTIAGAYMDNLYTKGGSYNNGAYSDGSIPQDYCWLAGQKPSLGTGIDAVLKDEITGDESARNFKTGTWPAVDKAFAYNFYAGTDNPIFKIYFDNSESVDPSNPLPAPRYAMVTKYTNADGSGDVTFENGKIYRITSAKLADKNIIGDEGGNTLYGVEVTVTEATWSLLDIEAEWAE